MFRIFNKVILTMHEDKRTVDHVVKINNFHSLSDIVILGIFVFFVSLFDLIFIVLCCVLLEYLYLFAHDRAILIMDVFPFCLELH